VGFLACYRLPGKCSEVTGVIGATAIIIISFVKRDKLDRKKLDKQTNRKTKSFEA